MSAPGGLRTPLLAPGLVPAAGAGLGLLGLGAGALLLGGLLGGGPFLSVWLLGVGLVIVLTALLLSVWRWDPAPSPGSSPAPTAPVAVPVRVPRASAREPETPSIVVSVRAPLPAEPRPSPGPAPSLHSSIPAQYASLGAPPPEVGVPAEVPGWDDDLSLPFSAGPRFGPMVGLRPDLPLPTAPTADPKVLEGEVERLRERVRALETRPAPAPAVGPANAALAPSPPTRSLEPPSIDGPRRTCTGCGTRLAGSTNDPLCWRCGRPLCATCYWRTKEGGAAHTCPACFARTFTVGVSGGRGLTPPASLSAEAAPAMATARR